MKHRTISLLVAIAFSIALNIRSIFVMVARKKWLATVTSALLAMFLFANFALAQTTEVVKPSTLESNIFNAVSSGKWYLYNDENDTIDNTLGTFVTGPGTPPAGIGSVQISVSGTQRRNIATSRFGGVPLADITTLRFSTYNPSAGNGGSPNRSGYLHFNVDFDGVDDTTYQNRLVFVPSDNGVVVQDTWKEWNAIGIAGETLWRYSGATWPGDGLPGLTTPKTWSAIIAQYGGIRTHPFFAFIGVRVGEPYANGYTENIDAFKFGTASGTTTFDFEPETPCTTTCYVDAVNGNDAFGGDSPTSAKKTIQAAVNQVSSGGTVIVLPGTYEESPNINKSLTLQSRDGRDVTNIVLQSGPTYLGSLTINGATVTVDGFTITGFDAVGSGLANSNILVETTPDDVTIKNNRIQVGQIGSGANSDDGIGLLTTYNESEDVENLAVTDNIFEPVNSSGNRAFYINPGVDHFTFTGNEINGNFTGTSYTQAKDGLVENNTVTGVGASGSRSRGLGAWGNPDPTTYGHTTFRGNNISNTANGIIVAETVGAVVEGNTLNDNDTGVLVTQFTALSFAVTTIKVNLNNITGNDVSGVTNQITSGDVDGTCNWWGAADGPSGAGPGSGDSVSSNVDFDPWLIAPAPGGACGVQEAELVIISSNANGRVAGLQFRDEDILVNDPSDNSWSILFDGSDVGLGNVDVDAFGFLADGRILLSVEKDFTLNNFGAVDESDILAFTPTSLGNTTAGGYTLYFDGSDVGLTTGAEDVDAIDFDESGNLVVSVTGAFRAPGSSGEVRGDDEDLFVLNNGVLGPNTSGQWSLYFDGSDVGLTTSSEDIGALWADHAEDKLYFATYGNYSLPGLTGNEDDIIVCAYTSLGSNTACSFSRYWNGDADHNFDNDKIDGLSIGDLPSVASQSTSVTGVVAADDTVEAPGDDADEPNELDGGETDADEQADRLFLPTIIH